VLHLLANLHRGGKGFRVVSENVFEIHVEESSVCGYHQIIKVPAGNKSVRGLYFGNLEIVDESMIHKRLLYG